MSSSFIIMLFPFSRLFAYVHTSLSGPCRCENVCMCACLECLPSGQPSFSGGFRVFVIATRKYICMSVCMSICLYVRRGAAIPQRDLYHNVFAVTASWLQTSTLEILWKSGSHILCTGLLVDVLTRRHHIIPPNLHACMHTSLEKCWFIFQIS